MKEYIFIQNWDYTAFEKVCSEMLREGWTAQGGIAVIRVEDTFHYFQAFVR